MPASLRPASFRLLIVASCMTSAGLARAQPAAVDHTKEIDAVYGEMMTAVQAADYTKARILCERAIAWEPRVAKHRYNLACIEALAAKQGLEMAFTALDQAVALGFDNENALTADPDLAALRSDPRFTKLVAAARRAATGTGGGVAADVPAPLARPTAAATPTQAAPRAPTAATARATTPQANLATTNAPARPATAPMAKSESPAPATYQNGVPVGLYFMTRYWSYTHTLEKSAWYFAPDGTIYENLQGGFSAADLAAHTGPKGRATLAGGKLTVTRADGKPATSDLERDGTGFAWDMGSFTPVSPIANAAAIAGVYDGGESLAHGGNQVAVSKRLELRADGTFTWDGVSFVSGTTSSSKLSAGATGGSAGTWQAEAYALTLTDTTGRAFRAIAFPYDTGSTPGRADRLYFAGIMYKRQ